MKKIYFIIFLILLVIYLNRAYAYIYDEIGRGNLKSPNDNQTYIISSNENNKNLTYVALGDSLTAGAGIDNPEQSYPYLVSEKLSSKYNILLKNHSELGYKSADVENDLLPLAISDAPDIVTLFIGVNDVHHNLSKQDFRDNYEQIIESLSTKTTAKIYLVNLPFIGSNKLILPPYNFYFDFKTQELNGVIKDLAQKNNLNYIDLYSATTAEFKKSDSYYSKDLFHPSAKGYAFWANIIYSNINDNFN